MEIKRTQEIFKEQFDLSHPATSGEFTKHLVKKWVAINDYETLKSLADEMFEQLKLMDYEKKAKETYDEFDKELKSLSTSQSEGTELTFKDKPEEVVCDCGKVMLKGDTYCSECGREISSSLN